MIKSASQLSLQSILKLDAATCAAMGALLALVSAPVSALTQISAPLLFWAGLVLFPVAGFMFACAQARRVPMWATGLVVVGNGLWVLASLALPLAGLIAPNALGWLFLVGQAVVVLVFAALEWGAVQQRPVAS
ncbi:hypothetical protein JQX09_17175 [Sulfitobacter pseudonitzschiae]|uniref:Uncharacterized protein n=1 Tax=Pseudosulfitobacter pseudonitzschiae TaxID=1402135 RepID=A0A9Q2NKI4_9RHOB|nr:hypothetical protein [Pseudosulfitobacter pseudonitzschiae]MBM2292891.1 hypothetical protein [Pseudosulfitobacter pseudonitzschiae]MBM2298581.1 hypothetical protein [Pseudosulfitobacter pseudonitzschiae]MBM2303495.1 hypothetical protein [Pseudosulfitobacter pseudonitzschiae]MBM2313278.1 hypothetical protein [Pseudosulfitobacter pseudonitzschiae]MBM2318191.1 hypothetical protein [Pseudosulfitobacter pseudonitzschiae]